MEDSKTYCGANSDHLICENYNFQPNLPLMVFERAEIFTDFIWLDIINCTGVFHKDTFIHLPNLEILNIDNSNIEKIDEDAFVTTLTKLKSVDIRNSTFPFDNNPFKNCQELESVRFIKLKNSFDNFKIFEDAHTVNYLIFNQLSHLQISKDIFLGLNNLKYLFIQNCTIDSFSSEAFAPLQELETLYITGNTISNFPTESMTALKKLNTLGIYNNNSEPDLPIEIDYQFFQNLPQLKIINFPEIALRNLDFSSFKNLENVQLVIGQCQENLMDFLSEKGIDFEFTSDYDLMEEADLSDPNIQICA